MELKSLAEKAILSSAGAAKWLSIDKDGQVCAWRLKPYIMWGNTFWDNWNIQSYCIIITRVAPPANFRNELYEISKIINNEQ